MIIIDPSVYAPAKNMGLEDHANQGVVIKEVRFGYPQHHPE
ncbi:hypothetical protein [Sinomonas albida]